LPVAKDTRHCLRQTSRSGVGLNGTLRRSLFRLDALYERQTQKPVTKPRYLTRFMDIRAGFLSYWRPSPAAPQSLVGATKLRKETTGRKRVSWFDSTRDKKPFIHNGYRRRACICPQVDWLQTGHYGCEPGGLPSNLPGLTQDERTALRVPWCRIKKNLGGL
jgi:hypothetical protein